MLVTIAATSSFRDHQWDKKTIRTMNEPDRVSNELLPAGPYEFKLLNSESNRQIVRIFASS